MDPDAKDLYERIGAAPDDERREIRIRATRATRRMRERLDRADESERDRLLEQFERVKEAVDVLTDRDRRAVYDERHDGTGAETERETGTETGTDRRVVPLELTVEAETVTEGERVNLTVTAAGERVDRATVDLSGAESRRIDVEGGRTGVTLETPGSVTLTARHEDTADATYESATATVQVLPRANLVVTPARSSVPVDTPLSVTVETADGERVGRATLSGYALDSGDDPVDTAETDEEGEGSLRFPTTGEKEIRAEKEDDEVAYEPDTARVAAERPSLSITADPDRVDAGEPVSFRVRADGEPVEGATVELPDRSPETGTSGRIDHAFADPDDYTVRANKDGHEPDSVEITVFPPRPGPLTVDCSPSPVSAGEEFTVTAAYGDEPVVGATVTTAGDDTEYRTGSEGRAVLTATGSGSTDVRVETPRGDTGRATVIVDRAGTEADDEHDERTETTGTTGGGRLELDLPDGETEVGDAAVLKVLYDGEPDPTAQLKIQHDVTGNYEFVETDDGGTAVHGFTESGLYEIKAIHPTADEENLTISEELNVDDDSVGEGPVDPGYEDDIPWKAVGAVGAGLLVVLGLLAALVATTSLGFVATVLVSVGGLAVMVYLLTSVV